MNASSAFSLTVAVLLVVGAVSAYGLTFSGPSMGTSGSTTVGGTANITLSVFNGGTASTGPSCSPNPGNSPCIPNSEWTSCPTFQGSSVEGGVQFLYYAVHDIFVITPNNDVYYLGSATSAHLASHHAGFPIRYSTAGFGPEMNVTQNANSNGDGTGTVVASDAFSVPFGTGAGNIQLTSVNAYGIDNPPGGVNPEGPYYWWQTQVGGVGVTNQRIDLAGIKPTSQAGTYQIDIEGFVVCGTYSANTIVSSSGQFFDTQSSQTFTATSTTTSSTSTTTTTTSTTTVGGATRTIGWWQTHLALESQAWAAYIAANPAGANICGLTITTAAQAMGGFWASIPKTSTGAHRDAVAHAEMVLVQQWIGALLNTQAFGTSDHGLLAAGVTACNSDDPNTITSAANALDTFNGSGDNVPSPVPEGNATPQAAKAFADIAFWDAV